MPQKSATRGPLAARYHHLAQSRRKFYLDEAAESAALTIPAVFPDNLDATQRDEQPDILEKPSQSLGARGVRNLASKLGLTLIPATSPWFKYELSAQFEQALAASDDTGQERSGIEDLLALRENLIMDEVEQRAIRSKLDQVLRHLVITGNMLVYLPPSGGMRCFPLNSYVVRRDFTGNLVEIIYVEVLDRATVPQYIHEALKAEGDIQDGVEQSDVPAANDGTDRDAAVHVYTSLRKKGKAFVVSQEANGVPLEEKAGSIRESRMPYMALRFVKIDGEDYGRGYIEEFRGDLGALEQLQRSLVIAALNAAKLIALLNPNASMTPQELEDAHNGAVLLGKEDDVAMLQQQKFADMQFAERTAVRLEGHLSKSFLLNSSVQRDAERVTAEEIRLLAQELEDALGGIYSSLGQDFQLPLVQRLEEQMIKRGDLAAVEPAGSVNPAVVTGLAAIGRNHEAENLRAFMADVTQLAAVKPELVTRINDDEILKRLATGHSVVTTGLFKSDKQMAEEAAAARRQAVDDQVIAGGAPELGKAAGAQLGQGLEGAGPEALAAVAPQQAA